MLLCKLAIGLHWDWLNLDKIREVVRRIIQYLGMKRRFVALMGILACGVIYAETTYGPFHVSDLGRAFMFTTLAQDQEMEYSVADRLAGNYLASILNTPAKIRSANGHSLFRVVYFDGKIVDFTITGWPGSVPLTFKETVASYTDQDLSSSDRLAAIDSAPCGALTVSVETGYWGSYFPPDEMETDAVWVDTGALSIPAGFAQRNCR